MYALYVVGKLVYIPFQAYKGCKHKLLESQCTSYSATNASLCVLVCKADGKQFLIIRSVAHILEIVPCLLN